jgi:hypothetical protein
MPGENNGGGKPPQEPPSGISQRELEAIRKAFEDAQRAGGLSPEEFRRIKKQWDAARASVPPNLRQRFEAAERERRAKRAAEAEAAEREAARQALRAQRKGIGGRRPAITPDEIDAARKRLRHAIGENPKKRRQSLAYKDFINWWGQDSEREKRKAPSKSTYLEKVFRPELGSKRAD